MSLGHVKDSEITCATVLTICDEALERGEGWRLGDVVLVLELDGGRYWRGDVALLA